MEGDIVQTSVLYSKDELTNSNHLATISNETVTATTNPISIASLSPIERHSPVCQQCSTFRLPVQVIHLLGWSILQPTLSLHHSNGSTITATSNKKRYKSKLRRQVRNGCWIWIYHINGQTWQQTNPQRCRLRSRTHRTNPVAHKAPATANAYTSLEEFEIPFPNGLFFSGKSVNDVLYIWESTSFISNAVPTCNASKKRKILEIDDHVEDVEGVEDIHSQSGSETFHPNIQPIGEAEKLTNFQFLPIGERQLPRGQTPPSPLSFSPSHQSVKPLYCSPNQLWHLRFGHESTTTLHKLPYIKSSHDSSQ